VLFQMEGIAEAAVIGVADDKWGEVGKAIIVLKAGAKAGAEDVVAHCKSRLAGFKVPKHVVFVPVLPRNAAGKVEKPRLRSEFGDKV
jgi:fatty-acyl-CoA synthase